MDDNTTSRADKDKADEISLIEAEAVETFLYDNPDWLYGRTALMHRINLKAEVEGATSLLEHQAQILRKTNKELTENINELNDIAEDNRELIESLLTLCVKMCEAHTAVDIYNVLQHMLGELYHVEYTQLVVFKQPLNGNFRLVEPSSLDESNPTHRLLSVLAPKCSQIGKDEGRFLFGIEGGSIRSAAAIPLRAHGRNYGICCLGSSSPQRYHPGKDLAILDYISKLTTASLERVMRA